MRQRSLESRKLVLLLLPLVDVLNMLKHFLLIHNRRGGHQVSDANILAQAPSILIFFLFLDMSVKVFIFTIEFYINCVLIIKYVFRLFVFLNYRFYGTCVIDFMLITVNFEPSVLESI